MNKKFLLIGSLILSSTCQSMQSLNDDDFFDNLNDSMALSDTPSNEWELSDSEQMGRMEQCQFTSVCSPFEVLSVLLPLNVGPLLEEDLYLHTYPLVIRSLLDNPLFLPYRTYDRPHVLGIDLFYNEMPRANFINDCSGISSYLAINESTLLNKLSNIFDLAQEELMLDIPAGLNPLDFLPLFSNFTVQERRAGLMLHGLFYHNNFSLVYNVPLYYLEHNFFTTQAEQEAIERVLGTAAEEDSQQFAHDHLISDKIGFGDTRFYFGLSPELLRSFGMTVGTFVTAPTSFLFAKGLKGSTFTQPCIGPDFKISDVVCQFIKGDDEAKTCALEEVQTFALGAMDRLASILLEAPLGNYRHVGLGLFIRTNLPLGSIIKRRWAQKFSWQGFMSAEYITPGKERRSFIEKCCVVAEIAERLGLNKTGEALEQYLEQLEQDPQLAQEVMDYIDIRTVDIFYPFAFDVKVWPGFVFRYTSRFIYEGERWGFFLGSDLWAKGKENITAPSLEGARPISLDMARATKPFAYQSKMFGSMFYKVLRDVQDWTLGVSMEDTSIFSSSIGRSFTVSLVFDATF